MRHQWQCKAFWLAWRKLAALAWQLINGSAAASL